MPTNAQCQANLDNLLASIPDPNGSLIRSYVTAKAAEGLKVSSLRNIADNLATLVNEALNTDIRDLGREELRAVIGRLSARKSPATVDGFVAHVRAYYRWLNDGDLPKDVKIGTKRLHRDHFRDVEPITQDELLALLEAASRGVRRPTALRRMALIWLLWDSGFRISEAMSLRIQDVTFDEKGGAKLALPRGAERLKTGPRTIYAVECVGSLRAWLDMHPDPAPGSYVFCTNSPRRNMQPSSWSNMLKALCKDAGIRHINSHLFRHTRATRAARNGWNEPQLRAYFGWAGESGMPARYVHLAHRDMEATVRKDAGVDDLGFFVAEGHKTCPMCAEDIKAAALKCKHCGSLLDKVQGHRG
jgi:integrase